MKKSISMIIMACLLFPGMALAHTGVADASGLMHGLAHPVIGVDHLLAMIAVGLWAAQIGGRAIWLVPATFVAAMILGGLLGFLGAAIPFIEQGIVLSVLVLGILIAAALRLPVAYSVPIVGMFALFHGHSHGAEMPAAIGVTPYIVGFALATATLHLAGIGLGGLIRKANAQVVNRMAGGAIAMGGIYLALA